MKFRTEVDIKNSEKKIQLTDRIFSVGSCFASEMSTLLQDGQIQALCNPFGTIFNPYSIKNAIQNLHDSKTYERDNLIVYEGTYISLQHHSSFNTQYAHQTLEKINHQIEEGNSFLS